MSFNGLNTNTKPKNQSYGQQGYNNNPTSKRSPYDGQYSANSYEQCGYNQEVYEQSAYNQNNIQQFDYNPHFAFTKQNNVQQQPDYTAQTNTQQQQISLNKQEDYSQQQPAYSAQTNTQQQISLNKQEDYSQQQISLNKQEDYTQQQPAYSPQASSQQQISLNKQEDTPQPQQSAYGQSAYGQSAYGQHNQTESTYSKYLASAYSQQTAPPPRLYSDGDTLTTFKDYYYLFASDNTKRMVNIFLAINYAAAIILFIAGFVTDSFSFLDFSFYIVFATLLAVTKKGAFALVLTIYNSLGVLLHIVLLALIVFAGGTITISALLPFFMRIAILTFSIIVTYKLRKLRIGFIRRKYTEIH